MVRSPRQQMAPAIQRKIALMGSPNVGKSSIAQQYVNKTFPDHYDPTIEDSMAKQVTYMNKQYTLQILDTAGQQEYSLFPRSCSMDVQGYVLIYAINSKKSFQTLRTIHDKILDTVGEVHIPIVIVGNKLDLQHREREVTKEEAQRLASEWKAAFIETSAKENQQVEAIFQKILGEIEKSEGNVQEEKKGCVIS